MSVNRFLLSIEASFNLKLTLRARVQLLLIQIMLGGVAEDTDVDIQPITRADFVPAKVFRSRSMNTLTGFKKTKITLQRSNIVAMFKATDSKCYGLLHCN